MLKLRPYQQEAVDAVFDWFEGEGNDANPLIVLPTGTGKSLVLSEICRRSMAEYGEMKIVVITHVMELIKQNYDEMMSQWPQADAGIYSAGIGKRQHKPTVVFCGIQSVHSKAHLFQKVDFVIVDECFTKDTVISTPHGPKTIDLVRCGDVVYNSSGVGIVERVSARPAEETYTLEFDDGTRTACTGNHPFFTERGWTKAKDLEVGACFFSVEAVRLLWERVSSEGDKKRERKNNIRSTRTHVDQAKVLLNILFKEIRKPNERSSGPNENEGNPKKNKTSPYSAWRERAIAAFSSTGSSARSRRRMGSGGGDSNQDETSWNWLSDLLQNGHSKQRKDDRNRVGRDKPQQSGKTGAGHKKNRVSYFPRLVNISRVKHESPRTVFNLQVSGHPSYFADGKLVHNCHLIPRNTNTMYQKFLNSLRVANPYMKIIGLTATPYRMDSGMLHRGDGALFDDICYEYSVIDAIKDGYLSNLITKKTELELDTTGVHTRGGEFIASELQDAVDVEGINQRAVEEIIGWGQERKHWLVFGSGVEHCRHLADMLVAEGISCETIFGDTPKEERADIIARFKKGEIRALCSMGVLTTGFNAPNVDMIAILRPTQSAGLFVQIVGRGMRLHPDKENCLILDFARNIQRHGPIDQIRGSTRDHQDRDGESDGPLVKDCPECMSVVHLSCMECPDCGYLFPREIKIVSRASDLPVLSVAAPVQRLEVDDVLYSTHTKPGKPPSLKVSYVCGFLKYDEWICLEHDGYAQQKARAWWLRHAGTTPPVTVKEALERKKELRRPEAIEVKKEGKYDRVNRTFLPVPHLPSVTQRVAV